MKSSPLLIKSISVLLVLFGIYACSHQIPQPQDPTSQVTQVTPITAAQREAAEIWFLVASNLKPIHVDWDKASVVDDVVVAPLADKSNPFASKDKQGYRYVVAKLGSNDKAAGRIVELVLDGQKRSAEEAIRLAAEAVRPVIAGKPADTLPSVSGWVIIYSSAYQYEAGYVYKAGALQQERVTLTAPSGNVGNKSGQAKTTQIQYITVTICGYVNGQLSNCVTDTYAIDTGDGGGGGGSGDGGSGGGGGGGGTGTGNNWGGVGGVQSPVAEDGPLTIGDHSKVMTYKYDETTDLKVLVEWTQNPPAVDKVSLAVVGLTAATTMIPFGNGTATIFTDKFGPGQDLIRFNAYFQYQAGTAATGPIANGTIFLLSGNLNTGTGVYNINLQKR